MPTMERQDPESPESHCGEHEMTEKFEEDESQPIEMRRRPKRQQRPSSQSSMQFQQTNARGTQAAAETHGISIRNDFPALHSRVNSAVQLDSETAKSENQNSRSTEKSITLSPLLMDIRAHDLDHQMVADMAEADSRSNWCSICHAVDTRMRQGKECPPLGTWRDLRSRAGCPSCGDMLLLSSRVGAMEPGKQLIFARAGSNFGYSYLFMSKSGHWSVPMAASNRGIQSDCMGVVVDPHWLDIARCRRWLAFCDENHGDGCHGLPMGQESIYTGPRYLIDVEHGCLFEPHGDERYFALSYVWGIEKTAGMATRENIASLKRRDMIKVANETFRLPQTVEDAIQLTKLLGERFLWVDRLCIIQDDLKNWHSQIKKMGSIYANAYCTLVASQGPDADYGITGLNQRSGPRQVFPRASIKFPSLSMVEVNHMPPAIDSVWNSRGWTFQEYKLSRRALFFNDTVWWACQQSTWHEDSTAEPDGTEFMRIDRFGFPALLKVEPWPNLTQWGDLVSDYCIREFRFEHEAGAAFLGIEEILSHSFPGGFCFGMPEFYFDIALLWRPQYPLQRRASKSDGSSYLPSWSFLGWKGRPCGPYAVGFACEWLSVMDSNGMLPLCRTSSTTPKVDWIQKGPSGQERRIRNDYHIWKRSQEQQRPEAHSQSGWQRNGNSWTHARIPNQCFRYPVPIGFQTVNDAYRSWSSSLRLRSQSTFLEISRALKPNSFLSKSVELVTQEGKWAGLLYLNISEEEGIPYGERCELVSISHGSVCNDDEYALICLDEWDSYGRPKDSERYEFYNVMWIKREGTYVVREAIGRVEKSIWDCQDLGDIDVELR